MTWPAASPVAPYIAWEILALYAMVAAGLVGLWRSRRALAGLLVGLPGLLAAALLHLALTALVPHAPIEPNNHGYDRFMSVRDLGLLEFPDGEPAHGAGWFVLIRPLYALTGLSPMALNAALSALSVVCFGAAVSRALDRRAGFAAAVLLAALPVQVRTAPTVSMFVVSQLGLTATWLLVEVHLRDRRAWSLLAAVAATEVSMASHLELNALAPLSALVWIAAREPGWFRELPSRPGWLAVLAVAVLAPVPHVLDVAMLPVGAELPDMGTAPMVGPVRALLLRAALVVGAVGLLGTVAPAARWSAGAWLIALPAALYGAPVDLLLTTPFVGEDRVDVAQATVTWVHAFFNPNHTSPLWVAAAFAGWMTLMRERPRLCLPLTGLTLAMAFVYGGRWDCWSTYVRGALPMAPLLLLPAGAAVGRLGLGPLVALALLGLAPYRDDLRHRWLITEEFDVLTAAHELAASGARVFVLGPGDAPAVDHPERMNLRYYRAYAPGMVGDFHELAPPLAELLALPPADAVGSYVALPLSCARGVWAGEPSGGGQVALGDRWWRLPLRAARRDDRDPGRQIRMAGFDACVAAPCAQSPCTCPDGEGPMRWDDPACAAVRARFVLEPVDERALRPDATGGRRTDVLHEAPVIGLYRVAAGR